MHVIGGAIATQIIFDALGFPFPQVSQLEETKTIMHYRTAHIVQSCLCVSDLSKDLISHHSVAERRRHASRHHFSCMTHPPTAGITVGLDGVLHWHAE